MRPREISNAVGAGFVKGPVTYPEHPVPVVIQVSWDRAPKEPVPGLAVGWTARYVKVRFRDPQTALAHGPWMLALDVTREPGPDA